MFDTASEGSGDEAKRDAMPTMGFLDHLEELRTRLVYSIGAVAGVSARESTRSCRSQLWRPSGPTTCRKSWST
jgi:hypothetical protein